MPEPVEVVSFGFYLFYCITFFPGSCCGRRCTLLPPPGAGGVWPRGAGPAQGAPGALNERLVPAPAIMDLAMPCADRASAERPFTSAAE